jgi:hypothetical protein
MATRTEVMRRARHVVDVLIADGEMGAVAPDGRRVLRDERQKLQVALHDGVSEELVEQTDEARRVARMWGLKI